MMVSSVMQVIGRSAGEATSRRGSSAWSLLSVASSAAQSAAAAFRTSAAPKAHAVRSFDTALVPVACIPLFLFGGDCAALGLDLIDGIDHRIEGQQRGRVSRLVVAHRLQHRDIAPPALGWGAVFLEHAANGLAQIA